MSWCGILSLMVAVLCTQAEHVTVCDDDTLSVACPDDHVIVFESANYGRTNESVCVPAAETSCLTPGTLAVLNRRCFGRAGCDVAVNGDVFTDACPGVAKYIEADYECIQRSSIFEMSNKGPLRVSNEVVGYITSPGYPAKYDTDEDCQVLVTPQEGRRLDTALLDLDVEARRTAGCYDRLVVRDVLDVGKTYNYCATLVDVHTKEPTVTRQIQRLVVSFLSDGATGGGGFVVKFKEVDYEPPLTEHEEL